MSSRLPRVTAGRVTAVLKKLDFTLTRQTGSHRIYRDPSGKRVTVPFHGGKILHPKVLKNILAGAGLTVEEFIGLLHDA